MDKLLQRRDALQTLLRGGVEIAGESREDEARARVVYDWLVSELEQAEAALGERSSVEEQEARV